MRPLAPYWLTSWSQTNGLYSAERILDLQVTTALRLGIPMSDYAGPGPVSRMIEYWHLHDPAEADRIEAAVLARRNTVPTLADCDK